MLLEPIDPVVLSIANQAEGQLVALEQDGVRVLFFLCDGVAEGAERLLANDSAVGEPFPVGLDARIGDVAALVAGSLDNLALGVALRLALLEDVELLDFLGGAVKVFSVGIVRGLFASLEARREKMERELTLSLSCRYRPCLCRLAYGDSPPS